ncbi:capsule-associated protein CAP1, partial [Tulasnella sp. 419]
MVKIYTMLSVLAALIVLGAEITRVALYFAAKRNLINDCAQEANGITIGGWNSVWGGSWSTTLTGPAAQEWCEDRWERGVWGAIVWLIVVVVLGWLFASMAFSYYHQLLSPHTVAPSQAFRMGAFNSHQPYGQSPYNPQGGYQYPAPRPGPQEDYVPPYDPHK